MSREAWRPTTVLDVTLTMVSDAEPRRLSTVVGYLKRPPMSPYPLVDPFSRLLLRRRPSSPYSPSDRKFLDRFDHVLMQQYSNSDFTTNVAAAVMGISRMHLNRKLRTLTGHSTHDRILERRLEIAGIMLTRPLPIAFVARSVGFRSVSHFTRVFRKRLGVSPSAYQTRCSLPRQPTGISGG
jgi:AraC-like DNA-binding protein